MADTDELTALLLDEITNDDIYDQAMLIQNSLIDISVTVAGLVEEVQEKEESVRIEGYVEEIIPLYSAIDFKAHFRMSRTTFEELCMQVSPLMNQERTVTVDKKLLATLWILANPESYRSVADRFGMSKGSLHLIVISTCHSISELMEEYICFPSTRREMEAIADGFRQRSGMPGVVGAIDGTHVSVPAPRSVHRAAFINRKGQSSMVVQLICDSTLRLLDVYTGWPGSVHDARVYRNSPVSHKIDDLPDEFHLLGDSAYPISKGMLVPFRDNGHLDTVQKKFNACHTSTRVDVERAIGLLKCKFRRLKHLEMHLEQEIPVVIGSCCVLHNFILKYETVDVDDIDDIDTLQAQEAPTDRGRDRMAGEDKRMSIALSL
ncbi:putative nuclease HARBI1 [Ruditapes philippinarum]|uniref:putative nuclease HARBI1 n=1 Tax=Ruditapes philippinarum TaxID=129788 RepID=UPI00295C14C5|nr:putative nuclease HARBI1 [Ruditapes philippinarum]